MAAGGRLRCGGRDSAAVLPCLSEVWRGGGMRFNKAELASLASHPSHQFDKEGVLLLREKHEGFFRRSEGGDGVVARRKSVPLRELSCVAPTAPVSTERWCRLRGNLLFYFKSRDHWSEPAGVIVLENCQVTLDQTNEPPFAFNLVFEGGTQHCAALCETERDSWITAIHQASFAYMRSQVEALQQQVSAKQSSLPTDIHRHRINTGVTLDVNEPPFLEISISCDNLRCDGDGQPPSPRVSVQVVSPPQTTWIHYAQTEVIERTSNPNFLSTVSFRKSDGLDASTQVRLAVYDVRERVTNTTTQLGQSTVSLGSLRETGRSRLSLQSPLGRNVGFITITAWTLEPESVDATSHTPSNATPHHQPAAPPTACHRRTQSLPPRLNTKTRHPTQGHLSLLYDNPTMATFRFHSGLGGDIAVLEVMAESRYCFTFPQQLLRLWISEERRWQEELSSLGDLSDQWHTRQMALLNQHVTLINIYSMALDTLDVASHSGSSFKKSTSKGEISLEMAPTNLHLQRLWAQNESLRRSGFYDIVTVGVFSAYPHGYKNGGLVNMLQKAKSSRRTPGGGDKAWASETAVEGIKRLRQEVTSLLRSMLMSFRQEDIDVLNNLLPQLQEKTKALLNIIEPSLVEEAFEFLDQIRVPQNPSRILTLATRCYSTYNIAGYLSPETALDIELMTPDVPTVPFCNKPEDKQYSNIGNIGAIITKAKEIDVMDGPENSVYRPTDEPEPWDLIQLNVQASVMCLTSKVKSFCSRIDKRIPNSEVCKSVVNITHDNEGHRTTKNVVSETKQKEGVALEGERSSPVRKISVSEAQNISAISAANQNQTAISSSVGSDSSHVSGRSVSSGLGVARTNESQLSSCTATPDVSPCEEDSGIGLERVTSEVEKTDCISEGGLSVDDERREDLLPLDRTDVKVRDEVSQNTDLRYTCDVSSVKASKLESIMEQSIEDLGTNGENEIKSEKNKENYLKGNEPQGELKASSNKREALSDCKNRNNVSDDINEINRKTVDKSDDTKIFTEDSNKDNLNNLIQSNTETTTKDNETVDWVGEVRPSMKKLRQAMDGLMRTARLVHSVFRLQQTPDAAQQSHMIKYRRDICFSQALTSLVTSLMTRLWCRKADPLFLTVLAHLGPLAEFECLVSCHGNDAGMLSDMVVAVEDLGAVEFVMVSSNGPQVGGRTRSDGGAPPPATYELPTPCVSGNRSGLRVVLPVPEHLLSLLPTQNSQQPNDPPSFCVTPVLFNIGINEEASLAEKLGTDGPQTRNNLDSFERISQYYHRFKKLPLPQENSRRPPAMSNDVPLMDLIDKLGQEIQSQRSKNPNVLLLGSQCCRAMAGLRFISCKSGKDRTGMSATLEQANILAAEYDLAETEIQRALNCMRSEGTRLENCFKSIGSRKYAFSALQLKMFPKQYRPPSGTYGTALT